jgi:hypothetical protein
MMDGHIDKALGAIEDAIDGEAFDRTIERLASNRPDVRSSAWDEFEAA